MITGTIEEITIEENNIRSNMEALLKIQQAIKSTKDQRNDFGKFNYRSAEGIYSAVKPLLKEHNLVLIINDELQEMGGNIYIVAKASLYNFESDKPFITVSGYAKEAVGKKGMSSEQVTGSASSYARKYALGGLFLLDDNKDPDSMNNSTTKQQNPELTPALKNKWASAVAAYKRDGDFKAIEKQMSISNANKVLIKNEASNG